MPAEIRCPHCRRRLLAEDFTSGEERECPLCHDFFTVPQFEQSRTPAPTGGIRCPRCAAVSAIGTSVCQSCLTDLVSGRRLPWGRRLARLGIARWTWIGVAVALVIIGVGVGVHLLRLRHAPAITAAPAPQTHAAESPAVLAERLLGAASADAIRACIERLRVQDRGADAVAEQLDRALASGRVVPAGALAAVRFLSETGGLAHCEVLARCARHDALAAAALQARARLGDARVATEMLAAWLKAAQRQMFASAYLETGTVADALTKAHLLRRESEALEGWSFGLRRLALEPTAGVLEKAVAHYWDCWGWLGQSGAERFAEAVFILAQPPDAPAARFEKEEIRAARRALDQASQRAGPTEGAALALVLVQCAPQYRSARERLTRATAAALLTAPPAAQQRLTWALARLTGREFGATTAQTARERVRATDVQAALDWAAKENARPAPRAAAERAYPVAAQLLTRVITPERQLEADLLRQFPRDWQAMHAARERWMMSELPWSPRIEALLTPAQRNPNPIALCAAMMIAAESDARGVRPMLRLWREASDQPGWVRGLAQLAIAALDGRAGGNVEEALRGLQETWLSDLPIELEFRHLGRVLASGGPATVAALRAGGGSLSAPLRNRLLRATEEALSATSPRN